ncbi:hypothetical protein [Microbacterium sp. 13-71-7]|uniref:hypothetical protein n=1 Tax=Microbacterium sp. 13-71-7 TaxID=1970399 RepID=UPI0025EC99D1|nr:hypothetical protein [Microbacterium sp. 13-71-7]
MNESSALGPQKKLAAGQAGSPGRSIQRRTIVKGAAWSLPVLATAAAVPMAAASGTPCVGGAFDSPGTHFYKVPAGVTSLKFEVAGGGGGGDFINYGTNGPGGAGALIVGVLSVVPGETLTLIVGGGGQGVYKQGLGGKGFGNGGNATNVGGVWYGPASGGGAGSAILRATTPLVVAGGGGGAGGGEGTVAYFISSTGAGAAGPTPGDGAPTAVTTNAGNTFTVNGGGAASGANGGAAGLASTTGAFSATSPGAAGGGFGTGANGGGNGASSKPGTNYEGAGGGGYAGGGSGGAAVRYGDYQNTGGNGGAGSSFTGGSGVAVSSVLSAGNGGHSTTTFTDVDGGPGYIRIACP